ncbi:MAG: alpha/beta hydrolase [Flavobacterium sp.]|nr:alpha/beta hydrolase [Flavobacterium sp.]
MKKTQRILLTKSIGLYLNLLSYMLPQHAVALAYRLFSKPRRGRLSPERLPYFLQKAQTQKITLQTHEIHTYLWPGNETRILLAHGWESNAARWSKLFRKLSKTGATIMAIDAPGHGQSNGNEFTMLLYADIIHQVAQSFQPTILMGHSIGGSACVYSYHNYPKSYTQLQKMVVLGAPSEIKLLIDEYVRMLSMNKRMARLLNEFFTTKYRIHIPEFTTAHFEKTFALEGLIAHDSTDPVVPYVEGKKLARAWTKAQFITTENLGHSMHDEYLYEQITTFTNT